MANFLKLVNGRPEGEAMALTDLPSIANDTFLGNISGSAATPLALTATQVTANLNVFTASLQGLVPGSGGGTTNFLRADGTWAVAGTGTVTSASVVTANGFAGTVATATTTPAITLTTSLNTPVIAGNGTALIAATTTGTGSTVVLATGPTMSNPVVGTQAQFNGSTLAASTSYVDTAVANAVAGVNPAVAVQAATTSAANTSGLTYNNGVSGVGATFTGTTNTAIVIDGFTFTAVGQRLLVKNDTQSPSGAFNGIYNVTQIQTSLLPPILTRALDYDTPSDINNTGSIPVVNGIVNGTTSWLNTAQVVTVGTTPLVFVQFSVNPSSVLTNPMTTGGDIIYGGSSGTPTRLANGNLGQVLTSAGSTSAPTWAFANYSQVVSKTTTYTALATDGLILCSGSAFTLTLPSASAGTQVLTIRKTDSSLANIITIARAGSDTISGTTSGLTSTTLNTQGETVVLVSDGTSVWHIENRYGNVTPWVSYTPTLGGMTSTSPIYSRRNGDSLEMYGTIVLTAVAASSAEINLGFNGTTSNVTVASTAPSSTFLCGLIVRNTSNTDEYFAQSVASQGFITIGIKSAGNPPFTAQNGSTLFGSTDTFAVMGVKVPITGWN